MPIAKHGPWQRHSRCGPRSIAHCRRGRSHTSSLLLAVCTIHQCGMDLCCQRGHAVRLCYHIQGTIQGEEMAHTFLRF